MVGYLQQFTFEIQYKPAEQMKVADALSRCENPNDSPIVSPEEDDPFFSGSNRKYGRYTITRRIEICRSF